APAGGHCSARADFLRALRRGARPLHGAGVRRLPARLSDLRPPALLHPSRPGPDAPRALLAAVPSRSPLQDARPALRRLVAAVGRRVPHAVSVPPADPDRLAFKAYEIEELADIYFFRPLGMIGARAARRLRFTPAAVTAVG